MAELRYDTIFAADYDEKWGRIDPTHARMVARFLELCGEGALILDAACGTGKYWRMILRHGCQVVGVDQSTQMLKRAAQKFPGIPVRKLGLQEMDFHQEFAGVMCVDAMENVPPEDWPAVLANFHRALVPGGYLYLTVEQAEAGQIERAWQEGKRLGLPVVWGEVAHEGGYHYYPPVERVRAWLEEAGFAVIGEASGDGYHHFLARKQFLVGGRTGEG
jgi:SAM-dependent methyltransferase